MASIRRRNGRYHVQIRKNGYPSVTKTFVHLKTAKKWASGVEADMERQRYCPIPETILLGALLYRYKTEILPSHQSHQVEGYRLKQLNQHFSTLKLNELTSQEVARYRDIRLKTISPASLKRELTILSRVLTVASNDWGHFSASQSRQDDHLTQGRQGKNQTIRSRRRTATINRGQ